MKKYIIILFILFIVSGCKSEPYKGDELEAPSFLKEELKQIEK